MVALLLAALLMGAAPLAFAVELTPDLYIEAVPDPPGAYVQSQIRYRVRLYRSSVFHQGDFITPEVPGAVIRLVGEDEPVEVQRGGRSYEMIERRYLLFPQKSGTLMLPGEIYSGREVYARGQPLELEVRPAAYVDGVWLPAAGLTLSEVWRLPEPPWRVGAHLERRVSVEVQGLSGAQIPPLALRSVPGLRRQRTRVQVDDRLQGFGILGRRREHHLYIPTGAGALQVPDLQLPWWDLGSDSRRIAQLPGRSFRIEAQLDASGPDGESSMPAGDDSVLSPGKVGETTYGLTRWLTVLVGTLLGGALLWRSALRGIPERVRRRARLRRCLEGLEAACLGDDPVAAGHALLQWGRANWGAEQPLTLGVLADRLDDPDATAILQRLDAAIYAGRVRPWDARGCLRGMQRILHACAEASDARSASPLPPLNP